MDEKIKESIVALLLYHGLVDMPPDIIIDIEIANARRLINYRRNFTPKTRPEPPEPKFPYLLESDGYLLELDGYLVEGVV
jgi:hypothetical protein